MPSDLAETAMWLEGPQWLCSSDMSEELVNMELPSEGLVELKKTNMLLVSGKHKPHPIFDCQKYIDYSRSLLICCSAKETAEIPPVN